MTTKGNDCWRPPSGTQSGIHVWLVVTCSVTDCTMPIASPAATVSPNEPSRPSSAAASAGTISSAGSWARGR